MEQGKNDLNGRAPDGGAVLAHKDGGTVKTTAGAAEGTGAPDPNIARGPLRDYAISTVD